MIVTLTKDGSKHLLPGFMVIKMPQDQTRLISLPSNTNRVAPADKADRMERICWATTDSTSMLIRLNSSKQPQAPVYVEGNTGKLLSGLCRTAISIIIVILIIIIFLIILGCTCQ